MDHYSDSSCAFVALRVRIFSVISAREAQIDVWETRLIICTFNFDWEKNDGARMKNVNM